MNSSDRQAATAVLSALREATASRHAELDAGMPLAVADPGPADCAQHLHLIHAWLAPIEAWLAGFSDGPQDPALLAPHWRTGRLVADLQHPLLAAWPAPSGLVPAQWPAQAPAAYRWGVVYVVEGAQLGGALLYRRLAEPLAPHPLAYLAGDGAAVGTRWQQMIRALGQAVTRRPDVAEACRGACDAFDHLLALRAVWARQAATTGAAQATFGSDSGPRAASHATASGG